MKEEKISLSLNVSIETVGTTRTKAYRLTCGNVSVVDDSLKEGKARLKELLAKYAYRGDGNKSTILMAWRNSIGIAEAVIDGYKVSAGNGKCADYLRKHVAGGVQFCATLETAQSKLAFEIAVREWRLEVDWDAVPDILLSYGEPADIKTFEWYIRDCLKEKALRRAGYSFMVIPDILTGLYIPKQGEQYPNIDKLVDELLAQGKEAFNETSNNS